MAIIKRKQFKEITKDDLQKRLSELRLELAKERAQIAIGGSPKNSGKLRETRKTIARILTQINKRKMEVVKTG